MTRTNELKRCPAIVRMVGFLLVALALSACGGADTEDPEQPPPDDEPAAANEAEEDGEEDDAPADAGDAQEGGSITIMAGGPVTSWDPALNPHTIPGLAADRMTGIFGTLVHLDAEGQVQFGMAESLESSDDVEWTLTLRDGIEFTDGTPYDAEAVKNNWDRIAAEGSGAVSQGFAASFETEIVDDTTLQITLDEADPTFAMRIAEVLQFIASPQSLEEQGDEYTEPVGAGPFLLDDWESGVQETLVRNPDYFEEGKPYLDEIEFRFVEDPAQRIATVVEGGAHHMNGYEFQFRREAEQAGFEPFAVPAGGLRQFVFNTVQAPFDDVRARQAVALAVDPEELVQTLTQDSAEEGARTLFADTSPYFDPDLGLDEPDLEEAQRLVDELSEDGISMEFTIVAAGVPELDRAAQFLQLALNELEGVDASVEQVPIADWRAQTFDQDNFDITFYPGVYDLNGPEIAMTELLGTGGADNFANYSSEEMDAALQEARVADEDGKQAAFAEVQRIYAEDVPYVVFAHDSRAFFHREELQGYTPIGRGALLIEELYLVEQ